MGCLLDKRNNKEKMESTRLIHVLCAFWCYWYAALMWQGIAKKQFDDDVPPFHHGVLRGRRREGAMAAQRAMGQRLRRAQVSHLNELDDLSNAFA